mgnify:FL=1
MKYDIEKEEQQFMNFINDQYNVYKEIDNIYRDYVKLPLLLSDALFTLSKHAGMYAMMRLTNEALENGQEEVDYNDEGNWELVVAVHNKLIDFLSDTVGPHYDQRAIDIDAEDDEDFAKNVIAIVDATFSQALGVGPAAEDDAEQNGGMSLVKNDDEN